MELVLILIIFLLLPPSSFPLIDSMQMASKRERFIVFLVLTYNIFILAARPAVRIQRILYIIRAISYKFL